MLTYCQSQPNLNLNIGLTITLLPSSVQAQAQLDWLDSQFTHQISSGKFAQSRWIIFLFECFENGVIVKICKS